MVAIKQTRTFHNKTHILVFYKKTSLGCLVDKYAKNTLVFRLTKVWVETVEFVQCIWLKSRNIWQTSKYEKSWSKPSELFLYSFQFQPDKSTAAVIGITVLQWTTGNEELLLENIGRADCSSSLRWPTNEPLTSFKEV